MNFWETKDWISAKTVILKTEKLLTKVEYLRAMGHQNFTEEKYKQYLQIMSNQGD